MIRCLLIQITRNNRGQPIRKEGRIAGDVISIGRSAECKIHLPDHRVNLHHAVIRNPDDGKIYIESDSASLNINGLFVQNAELVPGMHILIGPYEIISEEPSGDADLVLSVELVHPLPDENLTIREKSHTTLASTGLSKRGPALWLAAIILVFFLILPAIQALSPAFRGAAEKLPVALDQSWNPGQLSAGHHSFSTQCYRCHQRPFEHVRNQVCNGCHDDTGRHIEAKALQASVFKSVRCAECHRDHKGLDGLMRHDASMCVSCHGSIKTRNPKTSLRNISDFSTDHPAFHLTFKTGPEKKDIYRVRQDDKTKLVEKSGLKFSHMLHLDKTGVSSPDGDVVMECQDCHNPDDAGVRFKPISMKQHCIKCHSLDLDPPVLGRQLPHGPARDVMNMLREFYARIAISDKPVDVAQYGLGKAQHQKALDWVNEKVSRVSGPIFGVNGCGQCHEITYVPDDEDEPWKVAPVTITDHWLHKSQFQHFKHRIIGCNECHDVSHSKKSSDVTIPAIGKCRECHAGAKPMKNKVTSTCETCHGFHNVKEVRNEDIS